MHFDFHYFKSKIVYFNNTYWDWPQPTCLKELLVTARAFFALPKDVADGEV